MDWILRGEKEEEQEEERYWSHGLYSKFLAWSHARMELPFAKMGKIGEEVVWERFLMKGLVWDTLNLGCLLDSQVEILCRHLEDLGSWERLGLEM